MEQGIRFRSIPGGNPEWLIDFGDGTKILGYGSAMYDKHYKAYLMKMLTYEQMCDMEYKMERSQFATWKQPFMMEYNDIEGKVVVLKPGYKALQETLGMLLHKILEADIRLEQKGLK